MRRLLIAAVAFLSAGHDALADINAEPDRSFFSIALRNGKFDDLDAALLRFQTVFEADRRRESRVQDAFAAFASSDPTLEEPLRKWVTSQPRSFAARLARGIYYNHLAQLSRGPEPLATTPPQRLAEMARYELLAEGDFKTAIELRPLAITAHAGIVTIAVDRQNAATIQHHAEAAAATLGPTLAVCEAYVARFDVRHGGSRSELEQFIAGPQYRAICGTADGRYFLEMAAGEAAAGSGNGMAAIDHFTLAALLGDNRRPRLSRGSTFFDGRWYAGADSEFSRIITEHPDEPEALFWRGMSRWRDGSPRNGLKDMDAAIALDPLNPVFLAFRGSLRTELGWISEAAADFKNAAIFGEYDATVQEMRTRFFAWHLKDLDLAAEAYGRLVELVPNDSRLWMEYSSYRRTTAGPSLRRNGCVPSARRIRPASSHSTAVPTSMRWSNCASGRTAPLLR